MPSQIKITCFNCRDKFFKLYMFKPLYHKKRVALCSQCLDYCKYEYAEECAMQSYENPDIDMSDEYVYRDHGIENRCLEEQAECIERAYQLSDELAKIKKNYNKYDYARIMHSIEQNDEWFEKISEQYEIDISKDNEKIKKIMIK